jgi:tetratricopeptide (TPR) repeat protein
METKMNDPTFDKQLEMADNFYREANYDKAFKHYEKALTFFPYHEYCMTQIALTLYKKSFFLKSNGNLTNYKKILKRANIFSNKVLKKYPKNINVLYVKALICYEREDYTNALKFFEKTSKMDPNISGLIENKAECFTRLGKYEKAIECLDLKLKNDPKNTDVLYSKGLNFFYIENYEKAVEIFEMIRKTDLMKNNMKFSQILTLSRLERFDESISIGKELMDDKKFGNVVLCEKIKCLTGLDKYDEVIKIANNIKSIDPTMSPFEKECIMGALFDKGRCLERLEKFDESKKAFHEVIKNCKDRDDLFIKNNSLERLGHIHWIEGELKKAKKYFFQITKSEIEKKSQMFGLNNNVQRTIPFFKSKNTSLDELLQNEESIVLEFKSTLMHPMQDRPENNPSISDKENKENVIKSSLKTICAFLNTKGGNLLIGISDSKEIIGIEMDIKFHLKKKTWDSWNQQLNNYIRDRIGIEFSPYITINKEERNGKTIAIITVKPSSRPAFLDPNNKSTCAFFTRTNHGTIHCDVKTAVTIISDTERFNIFKILEKKN